jgi:hypothetical protein
MFNFQFSLTSDAKFSTTSYKATMRDVISYENSIDRLEHELIKFSHQTVAKS